MLPLLSMAPQQGQALLGWALQGLPGATNAGPSLCPGTDVAGRHIQPPPPTRAACCASLCQANHGWGPGWGSPSIAGEPRDHLPQHRQGSHWGLHGSAVGMGARLVGSPATAGGSRAQTRPQKGRGSYGPFLLLQGARGALCTGSGMGVRRGLPIHPG